MKSLITILAGLVVALNAYAAENKKDGEETKMAAVSSSSTTEATRANSTSILEREEVEEIKESNLSTSFEVFTVKKQASINSKTSDFSNETYAKMTYKIDEKTSARLLVGVNNSRAEGKQESDLMDFYVQYAKSELTNIGGKDINFIQRAYLPTSESSRDDGKILPQLRTYLYTSFEVTENWKIIPFLNPRLYVGDNSYQRAVSEGARNGWGQMNWILESAYTFNDRLSWTFDFIHRNSFAYGNQKASNNLIDTWFSVSATDKFSVDLGLYNSSENDNPSFAKKSNNYYVNLIYSL